MKTDVMSSNIIDVQGDTVETVEFSNWHYERNYLSEFANNRKEIYAGYLAEVVLSVPAYLLLGFPLGLLALPIAFAAKESAQYGYERYYLNQAKLEISKMHEMQLIKNIDSLVSEKLEAVQLKKIWTEVDQGLTAIENYVRNTQIEKIIYLKAYFEAEKSVLKKELKEKIHEIQKVEDVALKVVASVSQKIKQITPKMRENIIKRKPKPTVMQTIKKAWFRFKKWWGFSKKLKVYKEKYDVLREVIGSPGVTETGDISEFSADAAASYLLSYVGGHPDWHTVLPILANAISKGEWISGGADALSGAVRILITHAYEHKLNQKQMSVVNKLWQQLSLKDKAQGEAALIKSTVASLISKVSNMSKFYKEIKSPCMNENAIEALLVQLKAFNEETPMGGESDFDDKHNGSVKGSRRKGKERFL